MMFPRKALLLFGVTLLVGCGRNDRPTVRYNRSDAGPSKSASKSAGTISEAGSAAHAQGHGEKGNATAAGKLVDSKAPAAKPADGKATNSAGVNPEASTAENPEAAGKAKPAPKSEASASASGAKPPAASGPAAGTTQSQASAASTPAHDITAPVPAGKPMTTVPAGKQPQSESQREIKIAGMQLVAPESWKRKKPRLKILLAEFGVPASAHGAAEAQITVTQSIKDDPKAIDQLREEIKDEEQSKDSTVTRLRIADHDVILVDSTETDEDASPPTSGGGSRYRSLNAMIFIGGSVFFVTYSGPEASVTERVSEFQQFLQTLKSIDQPR